MQLIEVGVPRLDLLKQTGLLEDIKSYYLSVRDKIVNQNEDTKKDYQFIYSMNDDQMTLYIAYFAFIFCGLQDHEDLPEEKFSEVNLDIVEKDVYIKDIDFTPSLVKRCISGLYEYFVGSDESTIERYEKYIKEIQERFSRRLAVDIFKRINYNPHYKQGVKLYYLNGSLDLDIVGIEDDSYDALEYYIYCALYHRFKKEFLKHPIAIRRRIINTEAEECISRVKKMFDELNEGLFTLDDFYYIRQGLLSEGRTVVNYVNHIVSRARSREDIKNNGN